jgi:hypothetical protein
MKTTLLAVLLLMMTACGGGNSALGDSSATPTESALEKVARECPDVAPLQDNGTTLTVKFAYSDSPGLVCVEDTLPIPTYVQKQLSNATDLSGPITVSWDTYTATGSYSGTDARGSLTIHSTG